jgi:hypothetical protein
MEKALEIIKHLKELPADHEPDTETLWCAIHRIEEALTES